jgi:putative transposase
VIVGFIDTLRAEGYAVESICRVLRQQGCQIAARTYRAWKRQQPAARTMTEAMVINAILDASFTTDAQGRRQLTPEGLYGRRKMTAYLRRTGFPELAVCTVDRCMRTLGRTGVRRGKKIRTTIPADTGKRASDLLGRKFTATEPNRIWVADFSYVRTWLGFGYVAFIVDVFAQRILAWHVSTSKATDLVMIPLRMALWLRDYEEHPVELGQLIHHSDAGSQYTSLRFTEHLQAEQIVPSVGSVGDAYDNALMECIIGLYKTECINTDIFHNRPYKTLADVEYATAGWVDWYNNRRLHSSLGFTPPIEYEQAHYAAPNPEVQPV